MSVKILCLEDIQINSIYYTNICTIYNTVFGYTDSGFFKDV